MAAKVEVYARAGCGSCAKAKRLLIDMGAVYEMHDVTNDPTSMAVLRGLNESTVPQIIIDGEHVGGYKELRNMRIRGTLYRKLFPLGDQR